MKIGNRWEDEEMRWKQMDGKIGGHEPDRWKNRRIWKEIVGVIDGLRPGST